MNMINVSALIEEALSYCYEKVVIDPPSEASDIFWDMPNTDIGNILHRVALSPKPERFFPALRMINPSILYRYFPHISNMIDLKHPFKWHPEGDVFTHTNAVIAAGNRHGGSLCRSYDHRAAYILACMFHDIGKPYCDVAPPKFTKHEIIGANMLEGVFSTYQIPRFAYNLCYYAAKHHTNIHNLTKLRDITIARMIIEAYKLGADQNIGAGTLFRYTTMVARADAEGRSSFYEDNWDSPVRQYHALFATKVDRMIEDQIGDDYDYEQAKANWFTQHNAEQLITEWVKTHR